MITETIRLLAEDIAARQAQIIIDPPAGDDDTDPERDTGDWTRNLGLADDVLDLAIALNDIARLISRPRLAAWLDNIDIRQPASRRIAELRNTIFGPTVEEQPQPVLVAPPEIKQVAFDPAYRHNDTRLVDALVREYVEGHPDQTVQQVAAGTNVKEFTARRSLQRLVDANVIHYRLGHGKGAPRIYRPGPDDVVVGEKRGTGAPINPVGTRARIMAYLSQQQQLTGAEIADALEIDRHQVYNELCKLRKMGRLVATVERPQRYTLAQTVATAAD